MHGALDELLFDVEKLVRLPVQVDAGMRAAVFKGKEFAGIMDHEQLKRTGIEIDVKAPAVARGDIGGRS